MRGKQRLAGCLHPHLPRPLSVTEARVVIEEWRSFYNRVHPHSRLGFQSPDDFARTMAQLEPVPGT